MPQMINKLLENGKRYIFYFRFKFPNFHSFSFNKCNIKMNNLLHVAVFLLFFVFFVVVFVLLVYPYFMHAFASLMYVFY